MSDVFSVSKITTLLDPIGIFSETDKEKKARKRASKRPPPRKFTSGDSLLSGSPNSATAGTILGG